MPQLRRLGRRRQNLPDGVGRAADKRRASRQQRIDCCPQTVEVGPVIDHRVTSELFRRQIEDVPDDVAVRR